jgi:hypothetical protein
MTGLIFDHRGNLMSPNYSVRRGKRYRYYVSRGLVRGARKEDAGSYCRVGAQDLERLVVEVLALQLFRPELLSEAASGTWSAAIRSLVREHIERVVVDRRERQRRYLSAGSARLGRSPKDGLPFPRWF